MEISIVHRWALKGKHSNGRDYLLGRYCWIDGSEDEYPIRTFRTRAQAREARKKLRYPVDSAKPVKVLITVKIELEEK